MKPNNTIVAEVESTFTGENVTMGIDEEAMTHLMGILSEIYTSPTEAVAREYLTNAIDSHIESGQTRPVEVRTPNYFNPNLVIQDFGIGMDIDDIRRVYSKYGASTKRGSDAVNGMLGIGSKSAFAYSNNFTVVGIKNGRSVTVSVSRNEEGVGTMTILDESETVRSNGVTITVPVSDVERMAAAVEKVTRILPEGIALVDGVEPSKRSEWSLIASNVTSDGVTIKNLWRVSNEGKNDRIIMGNVAYEPTQSIRIAGTDRLNSAIYAEVEMGEVVFAPSREKLMDVGRTRKAQEAIRNTFKAHLLESIRKDIESAGSAFEAMKQFFDDKEILNALGQSKAFYKGQEIPLSSHSAYQTKDSSLAARLYHVYRSRDKVEQVSAITYHALLSCMAVITGAPDKSLTATMRRKIDQHLSKKGLTANYGGGYYSQYRSSVMVVPEDVPLDSVYWLDGMDTIAWEDVQAEVLPRAERSSGGDGVKTSGKHFVLNQHGRFDLTTVDFDENILYVTASDVKENWKLSDFGPTEGGMWYKYTDDDFRLTMERLYPALPDDVILVNVYANRVEKFLREYKNAKPLTKAQAYDMLVKHVKESTTDEEIEQWASRHFFAHDSDTYQYVPLADPDRATIVPDEDYKAAYQKVERFESILRQNKDIAEKMSEALDAMGAVKVRVRERYPLLAMPIHYIERTSTDALKRYYELDYQHYLDSQEDKNE